MSVHCEVVELRNVADADGFPCSRTASTQCFDCGSSLCESHGNMRPLSQRILSVLLFIPSSTALEARSR
jgi:hypothetical protein